MSLLSLATEILLQILSEGTLVHHDLNNVVRTCRRLHEIGIPLLYRNLILSPLHELECPREQVVSSHKLEETFTRYQPGYLALVQEVILCLCSPKSTHGTGPTQLFELVSKFSATHTLMIDCTGDEFYSVDEPLSKFLVQCKTLFSLREIHLDLGLNSLCGEDLANIFTIPNLRTVRIAGPDLEWVSGEFDYKPTNITKLEFLRASNFPRGLVGWFQHHPVLTTFTWTIRSYSSHVWYLSEDEVARMLLPLEPLLVHLRLTHEFCKVPWDARRPANQDRDMQLDFVRFLKLEILGIHEELAFPRAKLAGSDTSDDPVSGDHYEDIIGRLPSSLQHLTIYYDPDTYHKDGPMWHMLTNFQWLLLFADQVSKKLKALSSVALVEIVECEINEEPKWEIDQMTKNVEWQYPTEAVEAFDKAGIKLRVLLNPALET
ncbi:hypothetical protein VTL71DRAFT_11411 [Oculimacula yallundae]|uniref:F-box domain-containing protein n=1 Tax=Oculimacula yallundae TaxID=86028 RepID=A0ABR4CRR9_9HELO